MAPPRLVVELEDIKIPIQPPLHIVDHHGRAYALLASIYSPEYRGWRYLLRDRHGHAVQVNGLLGYRILGAATFVKEGLMEYFWRDFGSNTALPRDPQPGHKTAEDKRSAPSAGE